MQHQHPIARRHAVSFTHGSKYLLSRSRCRVVAQSQSTHQGQSAAAAALPTTANRGPTWSSFVSRRINIELALEEAIEGSRRGQAEDWEPELAVAFLSSAYVQEYGSLISLLRSKVPSLKYITGSTVSNIIS
jgi:hypothetical protein